MIYFIAGLCLLLGLVLSILGLRGRKIDDHPWCRKCKFDLFGRGEDADSICPECGCDLSKPKVVRIGQRRQRRGILLIGSLVVLLSVSALSIAIYADAAGINWQEHKPVWLLMREANGKPGNGTSDDALYELRRRYDAGLLTSPQTDDLVETALKHQADAQRPWQPAWGNFIQRARADGILTSQQWERYAQGIITKPHWLVVRPEVVTGSEKIAVMLKDRDVRMADGAEEYWLEIRNSLISIGPLMKQRNDFVGGGLIRWAHGDSSRTHYLNMTEEDWDQLGTGDHKIVYEYEVVLYDNANQSRSSSNAMATNKLRLEVPIKVVPIESATVIVIKDPAYRKGVEDGVRLNRIRSYPPNKTGKAKKHTIELNFGIDQLVFPIAGTTDTQTIDLACDIIVRHNVAEHTIGSIAFAGDDESVGLGMFGFSDVDLRGKTIDLILRPSVQQAENSLDCHEIWGEEIVFKDVEVK